MSANDLVERCDASGPTVYRRLSDLQEHDFLIEQTHPDAEGHHYKVYQANLDRVTINLTDEGFEVTVKRAETMANRFTQLIEEM